MIRNIIFDIGSVLVEFRPQWVMEHMGIDVETTAAISRTTFQSERWQELDRGIIPEADVIAAMRAETPAHYRDAFDRFFACGRKDLVREFPYAVQWLKTLRGRGYKIYLLSNYPRSFFELHATTVFTFLPFVDGKIVSAYVQCIKPDSAIYQQLLDTYRLSAKECVFIDDRTENIAAAEALGIRGIIFTAYEAAHIELEALLTAR